MAKRKNGLFSTTEEILEGYGLKALKDEKQSMRAKEYIYLRGKKLKTGNVSLFLDFSRDGKRTKQYIGLYLNLESGPEIKQNNEETFRIAKTIVAEKNVELQKLEKGFSLSGKNKTNLVEYILYQADEALAKSGNPHGYYYTLQSLSKHITLYSGNKIIFQQVDSRYILGFIKYLRSAHNFNYKRTEKEERKKNILLSKNTQHNLFKKFAYVINKAVKADIIERNPIDKLENTDIPKAESGTREYLTIDEIKKLIATPCKNADVKRAFLFACLVGLRYSDLSTINWDDLYEGNNQETLLRLKIAKTKRYETFPVSSEALKWLPKKQDQGGIYSLPKNDNANRYLKSWAKAAGLNKNVTFHVARHTAATLNLSLGTPIETVSKLLGHTKISTTQIYAQIIDENKKMAVDKQNGIFD